MALQPATRRLLTESAAAAAYRTAAQVDTAADARIAAKRGAALGLASLGADGLVPATQLPVPLGATVPLAKPANTSRASTTTLTLDPDLVGTVVPGTYLLDVFGAADSQGGLMVSVLGSATFTLPNNGLITVPGATPTVGTWPAGGQAVLASGTGFANAPFAARIVVVVTATGTLGLGWAQVGSNVSATVLRARSALLLSRLA